MQSPRHSLYEIVASTAAGFLVSLLVQEFIIKPVWRIDTTFAQNINITIVFTIASLIRSYAFRRIFNHFTGNKNKKKARDEQQEQWGPGERPAR